MHSPLGLPELIAKKSNRDAEVACLFEQQNVARTAELPYFLISRRFRWSCSRWPRLDLVDRRLGVLNTHQYVDELRHTGWPSLLH